MVQTNALPHVFKIAAIRSAGHGQRGRGQDGRFHVFKQRLLQDLRNINRGGLQHNVGLPAARPARLAAVFEPEDRVLILRLHDESQLRLQLLAAANKAEDLLRFLRQQLQLGHDPAE